MTFLPVFSGYIAKPIVAAPAGGVSFSDDFNRADADSLGANWTEVTGDTDIVSNQARFITSGFAKNLAIYSATSCTTVNQYVKFKLVFSAQSYIGILYRYTNSSSPFMGLQLGTNEDACYWTYYSDSAATSVDVDSAAITVNTGDSFGVTVTGTNNDMIVSVWRNPTANAPTNASTWDGGAAAVIFTTNPTNPVNTGGYIGIEGYSNAGSDMNIDDFYAGDIPT